MIFLPEDEKMQMHSKTLRNFSLAFGANSRMTDPMNISVTESIWYIFNFQQSTW